MRICMVVGGMLDFGGLEEFAKNLAISLRHQGHEVSVVSASWVASDNQYHRALTDSGVTVLKLPKWVSLPLSDWNTKETLVRWGVRISFPVLVLLAAAVSVVRRRSWRNSYASARNWLQGQLMTRLLGPDRSRPFVRFMLSWWRLRWRPELVHIHGYTSTLLFVLDWAHSRKIPVVYEEHQTPDSQFGWWKDFSRTINKATMVIAVSEASARGMRAICGVTRPIAVAYYMVPDPAETSWKIDAVRGGRDGVVNVTTFARLYVTKGLTYLLEAIARVKSIHPQAQFKIYGDGELRQELLAYADKLGLDGKEIFPGAFKDRAELPRIMSETDIYVMSSILEGLPIALLEAMAYGRPIVTTPAGGIPEAIRDGVNGLLCPPRDAECLSEKICLLIEDPDFRARLGRAARESYERGPYHPRSVCERYISIYKDALALERGQG